MKSIPLPRRERLRGSGKNPTTPRKLPKKRQKDRAWLQLRHWCEVREEYPFSIYLTAPGNALMCRVEAADGTHQIHAADGTLLARTTRYKSRVLPWPRRARWELQVPGQDTPFGAVEGSLMTWILYSIFFPSLVAFYLAIAILSDSDGIYLGLPSRPSRTKWRTARSRCGLDFRKHGYHTNPEELDHRIAYAQAVIHQWRTNHF